MKPPNRSTRATLALLPCAALLLAACSGAPGPDKDELEAELVANHLPPSWRLEDLDISVQENMGTEVEPLIATRFSAEVEPQQDLYKPALTSQSVEAENNSRVRYLANHRVIEKTTEASDTREIFGVSRAARRGEGWEIRLDLESRPWRSAGDALSDFVTGYVIAGLPEEPYRAG